MNYSPSLVFLELLAGYVICLLVAVIGLVVVWKIATGQIDISKILAEKDGTPGSIGSASMSRFQLLIFIFVIALSFFLVVISNIKIVQANPSGKTPALPDVPNGVLALLGISASSYAVGKAIQHGAGTGGDDDEGAKK
ncbi:MAG TPA: hypothetical protein VIW67_04030 [Terriglobales bacterium]|jgi:hypothetical protein